MRRTLICTLLLSSQLHAESIDSLFRDMHRAIKVSDEKLSDSTLFSSLNMQIPSKSTKFPKLQVQAPDSDPMWKRVALSAAIITTWTALGINEGTKWQETQGGGIDFIHKGDYHFYRGFTNAGIIGTPLMALSMKNNSSNTKLIIGSNLMGWAAYEVILGHIVGRDPNEHNGFRIFGKRYGRPSTGECVAIAMLSTMVISYTF